MCAIPEPRRPLKRAPRVGAVPRATLQAMQNTSVLHPFEAGIAVQQIFHHLAGVVVVLLAKIDAQARDARQNHMASDAKMRGRGPDCGRRPGMPREKSRPRAKACQRHHHARIHQNCEGPVPGLSPDSHRIRVTPAAVPTASSIPIFTESRDSISSFLKNALLRMLFGWQNGNCANFGTTGHNASSIAGPVPFPL